MSDNETNDLTTENGDQELTGDDVAPQPDASIAEMHNLQAANEGLTAANSDLSLQVETLTEANEKLTDELAQAKKALAAKPKGKVTESTPAKPRKAGPMPEGKGLSGDALAEAIADAGEGAVEIVFSNGKTEIDGVPARRIDGDVWRDHTLGKMLRDPITISGAPIPTQLVGYALFIDGKQVAWTPRSDAINLAPGQSVQLVDDIYFA